MKKQIILKDQDRGTPKLSVNGELTVVTAMELWDIFKNCLDNNQLPLVDLSEITDVDTVGMQVLISARQSAECAGLPFHISGVGDNIISVCREIGMDVGFFDDVEGRVS